LPPSLLQFFAVGSGQRINGATRRAKGHDANRTVGKWTGL
jgi:hypothetical protein